MQEWVYIIFNTVQKILDFSNVSKLKYLLVGFCYNPRVAIAFTVYHVTCKYVLSIRSICTLYYNRYLHVPPLVNWTNVFWLQAARISDLVFLKPIPTFSVQFSHRWVFAPNHNFKWCIFRRLSSQSVISFIIFSSDPLRRTFYPIYLLTIRLL